MKTFKSMTILIVDDSRTDREIMKDIITDAGYKNIKLAGSAREAFPLLDTPDANNVDLILLDIVMPEMDGLDACKRIRDKDHLKDIPIIMVTARPNDENLQIAFANGANDYITKPFNEIELLSRVRAALRLKNETDNRKARERELKEIEEELKRSRDELEQKVAERTKEKIALQSETIRAAHLASLGELSAGVAHEINNPINGIINCATILANKCTEHKKEKEICEMIISEAKRIANIVQALLSFARERKEMKGPVHLDRVMADALTLTSAHMRKDGIKFTVDFPADLPVVTGHYQQIQQVFLNVINNARYALNQRYPAAGDGKKSLSIFAETLSVDKEDIVRVTFLDKGTGIPQHLLDKVMNPFFSTKPPDKGTGLGLSISHGIIADHGGRLSIESKEGEYTKLTVDLPAGEEK